MFLFTCQSPYLGQALTFVLLPHPLSPSARKTNTRESSRTPAAPEATRGPSSADRGRCGCGSRAWGRGTCRTPTRPTDSCTRSGTGQWLRNVPLLWTVSVHDGRPATTAAAGFVDREAIDRRTTWFNRIATTVGSTATNPRTTSTSGCGAAAANGGTRTTTC